MKEERELKWKEENEASELQGMDKNAMREFYKVSFHAMKMWAGSDAARLMPRAFAICRVYGTRRSRASTAREPCGQSKATASATWWPIPYEADRRRLLLFPKVVHSSCTQPISSIATTHSNM